MEQIKIQSLLNYLGETEESVEINIPTYSNGKYIEIDNMEYLVLTEDEAKEEFYNFQMSLIDDLGLDSFTDWAKDEILNHHTVTNYQVLFNDIMEEYAHAYIEDLKYMEKLEEEMELYGCKTEEEFVEWYCQEDSVKEFKNVFGDEEYKRIIIEHNLIDWDSVIEWLEQTDGRGCLAVYDGDELELDSGLYAYRTI